MAKNKLAGDFRADALSLYIGGSGQPFLELSRLVSEPFEGNLGDFDLKAQRVVVEQLQTPSDPKSGAITASAVSLSGVELTLMDRQAPDSGPIARLCISTLELPAGLRLEPGPVLVVPEIVARDVLLSSEDILRLPQSARGSAPGAPESAEEAPEAASEAAEAAEAQPEQDARPGGGTERDFSFLDTIDGHLNVDLFLDVRVPVVGRRSETHEFRVPIAGGTFDYERLEGDINWLARSVLDIEVANGKLFLEKDVPLIPFDNKVLISWPLDEEGIELAKCNRTRLRTLLGWELPPPEKNKKSPIELHHIATRNIDLNLSMTMPSQIELGPGGRVCLGREDRPAVDCLTVSGELHNAPGKPLGETILEVAITGLAASLEQCWLGSSCLGAGRIDVDSVRDVAVGFDGFRPNRLNGTIELIRVQNLCVRTGGGEAGGDH